MCVCVCVKCRTVLCAAAFILHLKHQTDFCDATEQLPRNKHKELKNRLDEKVKL